MAIRAELKTQQIGNWLADAYGLMVQLPKAISVAGGEGFDDIKEPMLDDLRFQPPPTGTPERKIEWTSDTQRWAFFASDGFDSGIPYMRTGALAAAWEATEIQDGNAWGILVNNPLTAARFVYGSLTLADPASGLRFQQKFHAVTGWKPAAPIVLQWFEVLQKQFAENMDFLIGDIGTPQFKQRGITPRLPKG